MLAFSCFIQQHLFKKWKWKPLSFHYVLNTFNVQHYYSVNILHKQVVTFVTLSRIHLWSTVVTREMLVIPFLFMKSFFLAIWYSKKMISITIGGWCHTRFLIMHKQLTNGNSTTVDCCVAPTYHLFDVGFFDSLVSIEVNNPFLFSSIVSTNVSFNQTCLWNIPSSQCRQWL